MMGFFLCGCEAVYNVDINEDFIKDELIINNYDVSSWDNEKIPYRKLIDNNYNNFNLATDKNTPGYPEVYKKIDGYNYYNKELISETGNYGLKFNYEFNHDDYSKSYLLTFYNNLRINNVNNKLIINTGDGKGCYAFDNYPLLDKITINVRTDYIIDNNNADKVEDGIYTWFIDKDNYKNKSIYLEVDKNYLKNGKNTTLTNRVINITLIVIGGIALLFGLITVIKVRKTNK